MGITNRMGMELSVWYGSKVVAEVGVGIDKFGVGVGYHVLTPSWKEHECSSGLCVENGRVNGMLQSSGHK